MNGHQPPIGAVDGVTAEVHGLRVELEAIRAETLQLHELHRTLKAERLASLRDAVIRTRETIDEMEREHMAALRRIADDTEAELRRMRAHLDDTRERS